MLALVVASMPASGGRRHFSPALVRPARRAWLWCVHGACNLALERPIQMLTLERRFRGVGRGRGESGAAVALAEKRGENIVHWVTISRRVHRA